MKKAESHKQLELPFWSLSNFKTGKQMVNDVFTKIDKKNETVRKNKNKAT